MVTPQTEQTDSPGAVTEDALGAGDTTQETEETPAPPEAVPEILSEGVLAPETSTEPTPGPATPAPAVTSTGPYELPEEFSGLTTPPETPAPLPDLVQQELTQLRERDQHWNQVEVAQKRQQTEEQWYQEYLRQGRDEQTAVDMVNIRRQATVEAQREVQGERDALRLNDLRTRAAQKVARDEGVHVQDVVSGGTPDDMIWRAKAVKHMSKSAQTIADLTKRLEVVEQKQVPEQDFARSTGSNGVAAVTSDNIDALYVAYDRAHPNQLNPYYDQYRKFLDRP